jgi:lipopolysaccharide export system protein LptA
VAALDGAVSFEAGQVEYQMDNGKLICSGQPTMRLRGSYVRAKEFVVDMQRRLVSARRVRAVYAR